MQATNAIRNQSPGFALFGIVIVGFLISAMTVHPAELPKKPVPAACFASQSR